MAEGSLSKRGDDPEVWRLAPPHDVNVQGLVVSGFSDQTSARALFLAFPEGRNFGGQWLKALREVAAVTDCNGRDPRSVALAFTYGGLHKMGLAESVLEGFDRPFKEGMFQEDRLRRLGDKREGKWLPTVIPAADGKPETMPQLWSGNVHMKHKRPKTAHAYDVAPKAARDSAKGTHHPHADFSEPTPVTVDALLLLYEKTDKDLADWLVKVEAALKSSGVVVARSLDLRLNPDENGVGHEHFGFGDGLSQPLPYEAGVVKLRNGNDAPAKDSLHRVPLGDVLIGHPNAHGEIAEGPVIDKVYKGTAHLPPSARAQGFVDFGLDGSYLVVRELRQDVAAFWKSMRTAADALNKVCPAAPVSADWVAERVVGRNLAGDLLTPKGPLPRKGKEPENEFLFYQSDPQGLGCPLGSHVRRANPRDGLTPFPSARETLLAAANNHRILRRGRKFGPDLARDAPDDGVERGLLFMCLNTDITRQFEFIQQTWALNPNFAKLYDEQDPMLGPKGPMTIPDPVLRRRVEIETFIRMAGGEYFFLPSLPALAYLETLGGHAAAHAD